jgi:hypothetical protein
MLASWDCWLLRWLLLTILMLVVIIKFRDIRATLLRWTCRALTLKEIFFLLQAYRILDLKLLAECGIDIVLVNFVKHSLKRKWHPSEASQRVWRGVCLHQRAILHFLVFQDVVQKVDRNIYLVSLSVLWEFNFDLIVVSIFLHQNWKWVGKISW